MELTNEQANLLATFARQDVRLVTKSKSKEILIFDTKKGIVALRLVGVNRFTVTTQGLDAEQIFDGDLADLVRFLIAEIYIVEVGK